MDVQFEEGEGKPKTYTLRFGPLGGALTALTDLPFRSEAFKSCTWCGFAGMDDKRAVFYVDDFRLE